MRGVEPGAGTIHGPAGFWNRERRRRLVSGKVVNLRLARKQKARAEKAGAGSANAARFGRSKSERALAETQAEKARAFLDQHKLDKP